MRTCPSLPPTLSPSLSPFPCGFQYVPVFQVCEYVPHTCREGHYEATKLLLDSGAQINTPSGSNDDTPLTLACWKGHERVVQLLLGRGSAVNHQTKTGCTPLMEATR